jgi:WD40 repeat protein
LACAANGLTLASGDNRGKICLWDVTTGKQLRTFEGNAVAFALDGRTMALSNGRAVHPWDVLTGKTLHTLQVPGIRISEGQRVFGHRSPSGWF